MKRATAAAATAGASATAAAASAGGGGGVACGGGCNVVSFFPSILLFLSLLFPLNYLSKQRTFVPDFQKRIHNAHSTQIWKNS